MNSIVIILIQAIAVLIIFAILTSILEMLIPELKQKIHNMMYVNGIIETSFYSEMTKDIVVKSEFWQQNKKKKLRIYKPIKGNWKLQMAIATPWNWNTIYESWNKAYFMSEVEGRLSELDLEIDDLKIIYESKKAIDKLK